MIASVSPMSGNPEVSHVIAEMNGLYLSEEHSDVIFKFGKVKLPAHKVILSRRCPVFKRMFNEEKGEPKNPTIVTPEAPLKAFKQLLNFIYTGTIKAVKFSDDKLLMDLCLLAQEYEMPRLEKLCIGKIMPSPYTVYDVVDIINEAVEKSMDLLVEHCLDFIGLHATAFMHHFCLTELTVEALECVLEQGVLRLPSKTVFQHFVEWMKKNSSEKEHFVPLLKYIDLGSIDLNEFVTTALPSKLIDVNDFMEVVREQAKKPVYAEGNVLVPTYGAGAKVISGGAPTFFTNPMQGCALTHTIGDRKGITIDLTRLYMLNAMIMDLPRSSSSYVVEVSEDNANWTRIIDYSKYACSNRQLLSFTERAVRFIRIRGTASVDGFFTILGLSTYYTKLQILFDPETNVMTQAQLCDGNYFYRFVNNAFTITFAQPNLIDSLRLFIYVDRGTHYSYTVDVTTDKINWTRVFGENAVTNWRRVKFEKRPVVAIRIVGIGCYQRNLLGAYIQCPAT